MVQHLFRRPLAPAHGAEAQPLPTSSDSGRTGRPLPSHVTTAPGFGPFHKLPAGKRGSYSRYEERLPQDRPLTTGEASPSEVNKHSLLRDHLLRSSLEASRLPAQHPRWKPCPGSAATWPQAPAVPCCPVHLPSCWVSCFPGGRLLMGCGQRNQIKDALILR